MNKAEFIEKLAKKIDFTKSDTETVIDAAFELITKSVSKGEDIKFVGFGTFDRSERKARNGRNPKTGDKILIPKARVPRFRPGKDFKDKVNPARRQKK